MRKILTLLTIGLATGALAQGVEQGDRNAPQFTPAWPAQTRAPALQSGVTLQIEVLADGLETRSTSSASERRYGPRAIAYQPLPSENPFTSGRSAA